MKKFNIFLVGLAALGVASCEDGPGIAQPTVQPELPAFTSGDVQIALSQALGASAINLQNSVADGLSVDIAEVVSTENLPEGATLGFGLEIADNETFANYREVKGPVDAEGSAVASALELNSALKAVAGNVLTPVTVYYRIPGYVTINNGIYRLGSSDKYYGNGSVSITPLDNPVVSVDLAGVLAAGAIDLQALTDDKVETVEVVNVASVTPLYEGYTMSYKFILSATQDMAEPVECAATVDNGVVSVSVEDWSNAQKKFYGVSSQVRDVYWGLQAFYTYDGATYNVKGDDNYVKTGVISVTPLDVPRHLCTPNDTQGWDFATSQWLLAVGDTETYRGYAYYGGTYGGKIGNDMSGSQVWYGAVDGTQVTDPTTGITTVELSETGDNILSNVTPQLFWIEVDMTDPDKITAKFSPVNTIGIIGGATPDGWNGSTAMTPSADCLTWTIDTTLGDGDFKFRANDAWVIDLGGSLTDLQQGGSNIVPPVTGDVTITLHLGSVPYSATIQSR
ncbi:hypothetical protein [uncultured Duncaniella sp.]|uniref:hypothetical protein n=1 Tax=uncultured Duncaniella sp. TaxID=2768039 RepID=UPI0026758DEA|nr:hypothetical protein [uncultured Duncaniella sp.]MCI9171867.1 hypothetical protein [Muribaculaceae bacterium]